MENITGQNVSGSGQLGTGNKRVRFIDSNNPENNIAAAGDPPADEDNQLLNDDIDAVQSSEELDDDEEYVETEYVDDKTGEFLPNQEVQEARDLEMKWIERQ